LKHLPRREKKSDDKEIRRAGIVSKCAFRHAHFDQQRLDALSKTIFSTGREKKSDFLRWSGEKMRVSRELR